MRFKEIKKPIKEDQDLFEINMSPSNLKKLAAQTGAMAGMEFEMIVPDVGLDDVEPEYEPDYDYDKRARSFDDIRDFFHDGDYNSRRDVNNLMEEIIGEYEEWMQEQTAEAWEREGVDYMRDYIDVNDLFDRSEALDQARDEVMDANPDLSPDSEDFQQLINTRINELQEQFVLESFEDRGRIYDDAFETFAEEQREEYDEGSFLDDKYPSMMDIQSTFDISWPYYIDINAGNDAGADVDQVADEFSSYMGKPVNASRSYHGGRREAGTYVVEPDGSLEGDNPGDEGLEFVSPPMPIDEMISDLNKVKAWAGEFGCYTNDSTGLHINISVPNYSLEKLDYVKLALLMGDEYVLDLFGRSSNTYAKSAMGKIKTALKQKPEAAAQIMDLMKQGLDGVATKAIHNGTTDKYTSINTKNGYIEFRSPGGDWLDENFDKIENTLMRFTVALSAAINPEAYRKEYLTKLYKVLSPDMSKNDVDIIQLFSNYSAGELDKAALIRQVRQKQLARDVDKGKATGKMWWSVSRPGYFASIEVVASSKEEAINKAIEPGNYPDWARDKNNLKATPVRPFKEEPKGPTLNNRPSNPDGNYVIVSQQDQSVPVYRFMASGDQDAITVLRQWIAANPGLYRWTFKKDAEQTLGQPGAAPEQPAADNQGNWGIWIDGRQSFARQPGTHPAGQEVPLRRFPTQQAAADWLENHRRENVGVRSDIEIREIEPAAQTQTGRYTYRVYTDTGETVGTFQSDGIQGSTGAMFAFRNYLRSIGRDSAAGFYYEEIGRERQSGQFQEPSAGRGDLTPRGPGPWEIYRISDGSSVRPLDHTNRQAAGEEARSALGLRGEAPELYGVRTRQTQNDSTTAPRTLTTPGQGQQVFTGEWKIVDPQGRELHRFGGIGNVQADANRVAINWLRAHPSAMQAGVEVLPVMG
jgi:hypothetical protein